MDAASSYFAAERAESVLCMLAGALALCTCGYPFCGSPPAFLPGPDAAADGRRPNPVCGRRDDLLRSPHDDARVHAALHSDRAQTAAVELPRMKVVMRNFVP